MGEFQSSFLDHVWAKHPSHRASVAVETGTCLGISTRVLARQFDKVVTIEIDPRLSEVTRQRMASEGFTNVSFVLGDSAGMLPVVLAAIDEPAMLYLDAHWSGDERVDWSRAEWGGYGVATGHRGARASAGLPTREEQVPLLDEIRSVAKEFPHRATIYVDDFWILDRDGRGRRDIGFPGSDWTHVSREALRDAAGTRLCDWIVDAHGEQLALVLDSRRKR